MPPAILELSRKLLGNFEKVSVRPEQATAEKVEQSLFYVSKKNKTKLLVHLLEQNPESSVLVFSRTKHGANRSEEHTSELQSLMSISYAFFCLKKKTNNI